MKAFELEFNIKGIEDTIKIFSSSFVKTYRKKCIIIDNNKKIPLKEEFSINQKEKDNKQKKIKLIISNFRGDLKNGIIFKSYKKNDLKITKRNILRKHFTNISISMNDMYKITYKINLNINQTKNSKGKIIEKNNNNIHEFKIFGHKFVQNNKDKCVIIYNNKLYPLKEYFSENDFNKEDKSLELILVEVENVFDKSYMFHNCASLQKFEDYEPEENNINDIDNLNISNIPDYSTEDEISTLEEIEEGSFFEYQFQKDSKKYEELYNHFKIDEIKYGATNEGNSYIINILNSFGKINLILGNSFIENQSLTNMSFLLSGCISLEKLSVIYRWKTDNVTTLFY